MRPLAPTSLPTPPAVSAKPSPPAVTPPPTRKDPTPPPGLVPSAVSTAPVSTKPAATAAPTIAPPPAGLPSGIGVKPTALPPAPAVLQPVAQPMPPRPGEPVPGAEAVEDADIYLGFDLPGPERLFRLESEAAMQLRMKNEAKTRKRGLRLTFPNEPILTTEMYAGRNWPPQAIEAEPNFVNYHRLFFEEKNSERYGWDLGILSPVVSTLAFYGDVALLPYHAFTDPFRCSESSAGYCLPGDPVPYYLYPHELSATGAVAEVGTILALVAIFP